MHDLCEIQRQDTHSTAQGAPPLTEEMARLGRRPIRTHIDQVGQMLLINFIASLGMTRRSPQQALITFFVVQLRESKHL